MPRTKVLKEVDLTEGCDDAARTFMCTTSTVSYRCEAHPTDAKHTARFGIVVLNLSHLSKLWLPPSTRVERHQEVIIANVCHGQNRHLRSLHE